MFVVAGVGLQTAVQDAGEPVGELSQGCLVANVSGSQLLGHSGLGAKGRRR